MEGIMHITIRNAAVGGLLALALTMTLVAPAQAYEVWVTDQSDTGKESGGYLYIYDGALPRSQSRFGETNHHH